MTISVQGYGYRLSAVDIMAITMRCMNRYLDRNHHGISWPRSIGCAFLVIGPFTTRIDPSIPATDFTHRIHNAPLRLPSPSRWSACPGTKLNHMEFLTTLQGPTQAPRPRQYACSYTIERSFDPTRPTVAIGSDNELFFPQPEKMRDAEDWELDSRHCFYATGKHVFTIK